MALIKFITNLFMDTEGPPLNDQLHDKRLFVISIEDTWYDDILTYLCTLKFGAHISCDDHQCIHHQAPRYLLLVYILYQRESDTIL